MKPVVSVDQMRLIDAEMVKAVGLDRLIDRAGYASAMVARQMLGGLYGRRIVIVAGKGHNGDDGRSAARVLAARGGAVTVIDALQVPDRIVGADLVIDAAFGTGFRGEYHAPQVAPSTPVLALDVPSGLDAMTGVASPHAVRADVTVTFGAHKPGLLFSDGPTHAGRVLVDPIGFVVSEPDMWLIDDDDLRGLFVPRAPQAHKWERAVCIVAGSPGMTGAAEMSALGALRAGASMLRIGSPGVPAQDFRVTEAVALSLPEQGIIDAIGDDLRRCRALVVGPGLSTRSAVATEVRALIASVREPPMVVDADGLNALGTIPDTGHPFFAHHARVVVTPHDGEFARLYGALPAPLRSESARDLARRLGAVVLLKGSTTVIAAPTGEVLLARAGTSALATAGTGDVLSGVIGAFLARGFTPMLAAGIGAHVHGLAARLGFGEGLLATDLPPLIARVINDATPVISR